MNIEYEIRYVGKKNVIRQSRDWLKAMREFSSWQQFNVFRSYMNGIGFELRNPKEVKP